MLVERANISKLDNSCIKLTYLKLLYIYIYIYIYIYSYSYSYYIK